MPLYSIWCDTATTDAEQKHYWRLTEKTVGRDAIRAELAETIRSHYEQLHQIADDIATLGRPAAADILRERLPRTSKARSGELGEILATELVEENLGVRVPIRRLRYKDSREMPLRGDDFIGVGLTDDGELRLLKGEAKSRAILGKRTITEARTALDRDGGRCTPSSLLFVADRLLERDGADAELGRALREETGRQALLPSRIDHVLFTVSGNAPPQALQANLDACTTGRTQVVINLRIADHQAFIAEMYEEAAELGDA